MSFIKRWDVVDIQRQINACAAEVNYSRNDGFTQWYCKQDLLVLKFQLEEILRNSPKFHGEDEFIKDLERTLVWKTLQKENLK